MISIFQKTKELVAIFVLASALWAPSVTYCAAETGSRGVAVEEWAHVRSMLTPEQREEVDDKLCDYVASPRCTVKSLARLIDERGADVNILTPCGSRPLGLAAFFGHKDKVACLLDKGADIDAVNAKGQTALFQAVYGGHADVVALLLERGARMDIADLRGSTPLERVFFKKNRLSQVQILPILLKHVIHDEQVRDTIRKQMCGAMQESARAEVMSKADSDKMAQELILCRQLNVVQQEYGDCGLHALANAYVIDKCVQTPGLVDGATIREWHADAYERIAKYLGAQNKLRDVRMSGTGPSELMMAAKDILEMDRCCAISLEFPRVCSTTMQSLDHLRLQLPDISGHMMDNESIRKMFDDLSECYRGAVQFLCAIKTNNNIMVDVVDHWITVSVIKEGSVINVTVADSSNNNILVEHPVVQKLVEFIRDAFAVRLLEKAIN